MADQPDPSVVHLPAFMEDAFNMPRSRARQLIAVGKVRLASRVCRDLDVPADGRTVSLPSGRKATLPTAEHRIMSLEE